MLGHTKRLIFGLVIALFGALAIPAVSADGGRDAVFTYEVTIENLTSSQPLSPPIAYTHDKGFGLFDVGQAASAAIAAIAEDGNQSVARAALEGTRDVGFGIVTDVVDVGVPLTPQGTTVGSFTDSASFTIEARRQDRLSLATMLICTNDGFTGAGGVELTNQPGGSSVHYLMAYDAGTEDNTELSADIVDPCSALGPLTLAGDPNGNENMDPDTDPPAAIQLHPGVVGTAGGLAAAHDWGGAAVAKVTIRRLG